MTAYFLALITLIATAEGLYLWRTRERRFEDRLYLQACAEIFKLRQERTSLITAIERLDKSLLIAQARLALQEGAET